MRELERRWRPIAQGAGIRLGMVVLALAPAGCGGTVYYKSGMTAESQANDAAACEREASRRVGSHASAAGPLPSHRWGVQRDPSQESLNVSLLRAQHQLAYDECMRARGYHLLESSDRGRGYQGP